MSGTPLVHVLALTFFAVSCVVLGDTAGKLAIEQGTHPYVVAWSRFAMAALVLLAATGFAFPDRKMLGDVRVWLRALAIAGGISFILHALKTEAIADVYGAFFIGPVVSYILAIAILRERPSALRNVLMALGFVGVLLVVQPGFGGGFGMVFALAAGGCYGVYLAVTRSVAGQYDPLKLLVSQLVIGAIVLAPLGLSAPVPPLTLPVGLLLAGSALASGFGNYLLVRVNQNAEASLVAPLVYTQLITATLVSGWLFAEWPNAVAFAGLALILFSGLVSLWGFYRTRPGG